MQQEIYGATVTSDESPRAELAMRALAYAFTRPAGPPAAARRRPCRLSASPMKPHPVVW